jgi:hypothetical protein
MRWPEFMAGMDPSSRSFTLALGLSILLHAVALSIHFKLPDIIRDKYISPPLEVVLVNSKSRAKPAVADVLAQANLEGGGNMTKAAARHAAGAAGPAGGRTRPRAGAQRTGCRN